jgi:colicin import membrane protein
VQFTLRQDPGVTSSAVLAVLVHLFFLSVLVFGVRWQTKQADSIAVELWTQLPPMEQAAPAPKPEPRVEPPPPLPEPKPVPKVEPKVEIKPVKPDIAVEKAAPKKPEPKKPEPKKADPKPEPKIDQQKLMREQLERETLQVRGDREKQETATRLANEVTAARSRAMGEYSDKVRGKIRGNIVLPADIPGNPEAIFDVVQLPTGEVLSARLRKSSGYKPYDEAVERAILKASPLPKPDRPDLFQRNLELKFKPLD